MQAVPKRSRLLRMDLWRICHRPIHVLAPRQRARTQTSARHPEPSPPLLPDGCDCAVRWSTITRQVGYVGSGACLHRRHAQSRRRHHTARQGQAYPSFRTRCRAAGRRVPDSVPRRLSVSYAANLQPPPPQSARLDTRAAPAVSRHHQSRRGAVGLLARAICHRPRGLRRLVGTLPQRRTCAAIHHAPHLPLLPSSLVQGLPDAGRVPMLRAGGRIAVALLSPRRLL